MFYLIIAILIALYYIFMAPKSVQSTLNAIGVVGLIALLVVLSVMSFIKIIALPGEVFVGVIMIVIGSLAMRDVLRLPKK
ncbi:DUF3165 family protein [Streptococcus sp. HF-1907]|uniref:DUF3165 family protein n=1 Tax=Streptococcus sp. HF-1907 TaxID=2785793 RepID=UPI00189EBC16|nr:DUF3165 family protein [Streptococcus sp. HF-1907]MBF7094575.1 DUF3165 family protein [Streptococcus sp. HF-1907]